MTTKFFFVFVVSDQVATSRGCLTRVRKYQNQTGCRTSTDGAIEGVPGNVCVCDTDLCNGAVMTSSFGHVIVAVALAINLIIGYLL